MTVFYIRQQYTKLHGKINSQYPDNENSQNNHLISRLQAYYTSFLGSRQGDWLLFGSGHPAGSDFSKQGESTSLFGGCLKSSQGHLNVFSYLLGLCVNGKSLPDHQCPEKVLSPQKGRVQPMEGNNTEKTFRVLSPRATSPPVSIAKPEDKIGGGFR